MACMVNPAVVGVVHVPVRVSLILAAGDQVLVLQMLLRSAVANGAMLADTSAALTASASMDGTEYRHFFMHETIIYNDL